VLGIPTSGNKRRVLLPDPQESNALELLSQLSAASLAGEELTRTKRSRITRERQDYLNSQSWWAASSVSESRVISDRLGMGYADGMRGISETAS
jgi:hypothetical protein